MVEPVAKICPYSPSHDEKQVRFVIAKAAMEGLASANMKTISHPMSISLWVLLASLLIHILAYISLILPFGSAAVPIILFSDWNNRWYFDDLSRRVLRGSDMVQLEEYYSNHPISGLWILEFAGQLIGVVALDASSSDKTSSDVAVLRHIYVDEPYRTTIIQKDLIEYAVQKAFTPEHSNVKRVITSSSPLREYVEKALDEVGFRYDGVSDTVGLLKWKVSKRVLTRDEWERRQSSS
ncbi:hypothetical protein C8R42DRAFT_672025 [Lentinula raphanica]|nr:hypothetical protein C8R42DRAFT_672025 [Lentinula raphanica]